MIEPGIEPNLPDWVPDSAARYLAHTEAGRSIRDLARVCGCHASTVLRQIRRVESRRDDPLVDAALQSLATAQFPAVRHGARALPRSGPLTQEPRCMSQTADSDLLPDGPTLEREARRVLRRLCEAGAVLAVAENMENAVVVRDDAQGASTRTAVVARHIAEAMALKDWIACTGAGRISRYQITAAGRAELSRLIAAEESRAQLAGREGFAEAQTPFMPQGTWCGRGAADDDSRGRRVRYNIAESPLAALARRKDRDGQPFLTGDMVRAGERLREDFELAQIGPSVAQNWERFLTGGGRDSFGPDRGAGIGPAGARDRVAGALADLGPGLADVALRCCCFLEGLETAEKRMGWSARSGKIVLRIALQRLEAYYNHLSEPERQLIG